MEVFAREERVFEGVGGGFQRRRVEVDEADVGAFAEEATGGFDAGAVGACDEADYALESMDGEGAVGVRGHCVLGGEADGMRRSNSVHCGALDQNRLHCWWKVDSEIQKLRICDLL